MGDDHTLYTQVVDTLLVSLDREQGTLRYLDRRGT